MFQITKRTYVLTNNNKKKKNKTTTKLPVGNSEQPFNQSLMFLRIISSTSC